LLNRRARHAEILGGLSFLGTHAQAIPPPYK